MVAGVAGAAVGMVAEVGAALMTAAAVKADGVAGGLAAAGMHDGSDGVAGACGPASGNASLPAARTSSEDGWSGESDGGPAGPMQDLESGRRVGYDILSRPEGQVSDGVHQAGELLPNRGWGGAGDSGGAALKVLAGSGRVDNEASGAGGVEDLFRQEAALGAAEGVGSEDVQAGAARGAAARSAVAAALPEVGWPATEAGVDDAESEGRAADADNPLADVRLRWWESAEAVAKLWQSLLRLPLDVGVNI